MENMGIGTIFGKGDKCVSCRDVIIAEMSLNGLVFICLGCGRKSIDLIGYLRRESDKNARILLEKV